MTSRYDRAVDARLDFLRSLEGTAVVEGATVYVMTGRDYDLDEESARMRGLLAGIVTDAQVYMYDHRFIVRGHWRRQWMPPKQRHEPRWIAPFVKGPEDAPLKVRDKVNVVRPRT